ncbi:odorant receptor 131-2-like [Melanotaenia boesemani]|uniref:odorant receptor 131-2-like n=1 Tax=Melanotaenia boesemani TaxID=1250792 RepID=UPI001C03CB87|nr:odorant receptor 131-2-like [Melanotaenia boesemani]
MNVTKVPQLMPLETSAKALMTVMPCLLFLYINSVMVFALLKKPFFMDSPRYVLFGHLLFTDSLQLLLCMMLYLFAVTQVRMITHVCIIVTQFAVVTIKISPLNLAVMSLERYVAICFPLRHSTIATSRTTRIAIAVMWTVASLDSFTQLFLFISLEKTGFTTQGFCIISNVFQLQVYMTVNRAFTIVNFVLVSLIIIYTYVALVVTVRSASFHARNANKAHRTVLLHLLQFCLCLVSTLFSMINSASLLNVNPSIALHIQYVLFVGLIIFPKCLSPLIYGLRDQTFRCVFIYYFTFGSKSTVESHPRS